MNGRGLRNRRRTAALLAASFFTIALLAPTGAHAQVYIPPPDDLIEPHPFPSGDDASAVIDTVADPSRPRLVLEVDRDDAWIGAWYPVDDVIEVGDRIRITLPLGSSNGVVKR